jgi:hypothetical protein
MLEQKWNENMPLNDNQIAMLGHLIGLLSCLSGVYGLIGTIIFYFVCAGKNAFVNYRYPKGIAASHVNTPTNVGSSMRILVSVPDTSSLRANFLIFFAAWISRS